jgi:hypothetical protein
VILKKIVDCSRVVSQGLPEKSCRFRSYRAACPPVACTLNRHHGAGPQQRNPAEFAARYRPPAISSDLNGEGGLFLEDMLK